MVEDALAALRQIFAPPYRAVLWKTLGLTLALLGLAFISLHRLLILAFAHVLPAASQNAAAAWVATALSFLSGVGLIAGLAFLVTPVSFLVAGYFFDELAAAAEREFAPDRPPGRALPLPDSLWLSAKFATLSLLVNALALFFMLIPGLNAVAFFAANAYLSGRGYFEFAAARLVSFTELTKLRQRNELRILGAGLILAAFLAIPLLNLLTPLFGAAFMVRVAGRILSRAYPPGGRFKPP